MGVVNDVICRRKLCKVEPDIRWFRNPGGMDIMTGWKEWAMNGFWRNCSSLSRMGFLDLEVGGKIVS